MRILLATPAYGGMITTRYLASFIETMSVLNDKGHALSWTSLEDGNTGQARNKAADIALRNNFDKLMFIDSDQVWKAEQVLMLIDSDQEIVGGTYPKRSLPIVLNFNPLPEHRGLFCEQKNSVQDYLKYKAAFADKKGLVEVCHLPTGFLLVDVSVFKSLKNRTPMYKSTDSKTKEPLVIRDYFPYRLVKPLDSDVCMYETEDWGFCTEAIDVGYKVYLQTNCVVDHLGSFKFSIYGAQK